MLNRQKNLSKSYASLASGVGNLGSVIVLFACWVLAHPYRGIWHDARVYLIQAYHLANPQWFVGELWFAYGSQGNFTIFPYLYLKVLKLFSVMHGAFIVSMFGGLFWILALYALIGFFVQGCYRFILVLMLVCLPLSYSIFPSLDLYLNENFATARPFSLGLACIALYLYLRRKSVMVGICSLMALILHPLMGAGAVTIIIFTELLKLNSKWIWVAVIGVILFLLMLSLPNMSGVWFELVRSTSRIVVVKSMHSIQWFPIVLVMSSLILGWRLASYREIYFSALVVVALCILLSLVCSLILPVALILQLQPWRILSVGLVLVFVVIADILRQVAPSKQRFFVIWFGGVWIVACAQQQYVLLILGLCLAFRPRYLKPMFESADVQLSTLIILTLWLVCCGWLRGGGISEQLLMLRFMGQAFYLWLPIFFLPLACGVTYSLVTHWIAKVAVLCLTVIFALVSHDQRGVRQIQTELSYSLDQSLGQNEFEGKVVFWPDHAEWVWFGLRAANYVGSIQAIGIAFYQEHALNLWRRMAWVESIAPRVPKNVLFDKEEGWDLHSAKWLSGAAWLSGLDLIHLCKKSNVDVVFLRKNYPSLGAKKITSLLVDDGLWFSYGCAVVREGADTYDRPYRVN
ncbi:hypothetical protein HZU75_05310 [Chitinibacter fontanus]|uniref:Uncharacterized protein n=1 Tax=Chitinibacter fontanus TaxID=1737446 RepID=A0A7D5ZFR8_9NEIS|nr:hypothetical protein [Chitinibacter fontanus]QLI80987.1 hypothetical protein HZU75_05310 [Chitinibacter fontanus]